MNSDVPEVFELCVIGSGLAGLNALFSAQTYLDDQDKVVVIDKRPAPGGMWQETYDYVRLHQPHPTFTVGNIGWGWDKPNWHLAKGSEVQKHLTHCRDRCREGLNLTELYGCEARILPNLVDDCVLVEYRSAEETRVIRAKKVIHAAGANVPSSQRLAFSSDQVRSVVPEDISLDGTLESDAPLVIVGGGKTGFDTIAEVLRRNPSRDVTLVTGKGTAFLDRDKIFPKGRKRWWGGTRVLKMSRDIAMRFDGSNAADAFDFAKSQFFIDPFGDAEQFQQALISSEECNLAIKGIRRREQSYLLDVEQTKSGPEMVLQNGERISVAPETVFVNCTGSIFRTPGNNDEAFAQNGRVLHITMNDTMHALSSVSAYFMTHVLFLGKAKEIPLYLIDLQSLFVKDRQSWFAVCYTQSVLNTLALMDHIPLDVSEKCGLDYDTWYPLYRRIAGFIDMKINRRKYFEHCVAALDTVRKRHGIRGGFLNQRQFFAPEVEKAS